jgi:hypothetical protein
MDMRETKEEQVFERELFIIQKEEENASDDAKDAPGCG